MRKTFLFLCGALTLCAPMLAADRLISSYEYRVAYREPVKPAATPSDEPALKMTREAELQKQADEGAGSLVMTGTGVTQEITIQDFRKSMLAVANPEWALDMWKFSTVYPKAVTYDGERLAAVLTMLKFSEDNLSVARKALLVIGTPAGTDWKVIELPLFIGDGSYYYPQMGIRWKNGRILTGYVHSVSVPNPNQITEILVFDEAGNQLAMFGSTGPLYWDKEELYYFRNGAVRAVNYATLDERTVARFPDNEFTSAFDAPSDKPLLEQMYVLGGQPVALKYDGTGATGRIIVAARGESFGVDLPKEFENTGEQFALLRAGGDTCAFRLDNKASFELNLATKSVAPLKE